MVTITFPNSTTERRAVAFMIGKFSGRVIRPGVHLLPEEAVEALTAHNIPFIIKVPSTKKRPGETPEDVVAAPIQRRRQRPGKVAKKFKT